MAGLEGKYDYSVNFWAPLSHSTSELVLCMLLPMVWNVVNCAALFQPRNIAGQYFPMKAQMMNSALKKARSFK